MHLSKQILGLWSSRGLPESKSCDMEGSQVRRSGFGHLTRLTQLTERNLSALDACAHSEMRRAQTHAQHAKESSLARIQLAKQLPR
jgi:hypothetical protein